MASGVHGCTVQWPSLQWRLGQGLEIELVMGLQVCEHLQRVAKPLGVWVAPIVGGISPAKQTRLLGRQPQVPCLPAPMNALWLRQQLPSAPPALHALGRSCCNDHQSTSVRTGRGS